jgi:hypothetical protein
VSVFYVDLSKKLEKQETLRKAMIVELQQLESSLDQEIIRKFAPLSKIETGKRLSLTRKIVEFMQDPHILVQDQYKAIYTSLKPILNQTRINWKKIFTLNNSISELTQEIEKNKKSMESNEKQPPKFTRKPGPVFSQFICYQESGELLDFTLDELRFFTTLFA